MLDIDEDEDDRRSRLRRVVLMSTAPEAFEWLRQATYAYARTCTDTERQYEPLRAWCMARLTEWVAGHPDRSDLPQAQVVVTAAGVARYVSKNYRPHRRRTAPRKTADQRAAEELLISFGYAEIAKPSVRRVADVMDMSKTKAGRLLARQGVAPVRTSRRAALRPLAQRVFDLIDRVHGHEGDISIALDHLAHQLWPRADNDATRRQHRKRVLDALRESEAARLGIHIHASATHVAIRRGRKWKPGEGAAAIAAANDRGEPLLGTILAVPAVGGVFWTSPEIIRILAVLRLGAGERLSYQDLPLFIRAHSEIRALDTTPLARLLDRAFQSGHSDDDAYAYMGRDCARLLADEDPARQQRGRDLGRLRNTLSLVKEDGRWGRCAIDCLGTVLDETGIRHGADVVGQQRIDHLRQLFEQLWRTENDDPDSAISGVHEGLALCRRLAREEAAGLWQAPDYSDVPF